MLCHLFLFLFLLRIHVLFEIVSFLEYLSCLVLRERSPGRTTGYDYQWFLRWFQPDSAVLRIKRRVGCQVEGSLLRQWPLPSGESQIRDASYIEVSLVELPYSLTRGRSLNDLNSPFATLFITLNLVLHSNGTKFISDLGFL